MVSSCRAYKIIIYAKIMYYCPDSFILDGQLQVKYTSRCQHYYTVYVIRPHSEAFTMNTMLKCIREMIFGPFCNKFALLFFTSPIKLNVQIHILPLSCTLGLCMNFTGNMECMEINDTYGHLLMLHIVI